MLLCGNKNSDVTAILAIFILTLLGFILKRNILTTREIGLSKIVLFTRDSACGKITKKNS